ncbi:MAG: thiamine phosphate synthase [SAR202 cluster bacterium]|nr:MAG: thiamine phosphate synthase [SAR202 cluster bacterium]
MIFDTPILCLVTNQLRSDNNRTLETIESVTSCGVNMIQVREKSMPIDSLVAYVKKINFVKNDSLLIVNSNFQINQFVDIDGIHLSESTEQLDASISSHLIVGQSVHSIESARIAYSNNVDYIVAGTIFKSKSHPGGPISGTKLIAQIKNELDVPVIGIGGINQFNVKDVMSAGADGIAVIGSVLEAQDPVNATKRLKTIMNENFRG